MASTDHGPGLLTGIPRPSRLPRAPTSTVSTADLRDAASKASTLPRLAGGKSLRSRPSVTLKDNANISDGSRFGWHHQTHDDHAVNSPISEREVTISGEIEGGQTSLIEDVHNVPMPHRKSLEQKKKKPRPSLSERTIETLAQIPPTPSPSRRKSSISNAMGPPPLRSPIAHAADEHFSRGRSVKHTEEMTSSETNSIRQIASPLRTTRTPSKPSLEANGARSVKPLSSATRRVSAAVDTISQTTKSNSPSPGAAKMKSMHDLRAAASKQPLRKPSMNFRDVAAPPVSKSGSSQVSKHTSNVSKPRLSHGNSSNTTSSGPKKRSSFYTTRAADTHEPAFGDMDEQSGSRSSASLRATIAKAKAAKRQAAAKAKAPGVANDFDITMDHSPINDSAITAIWAGSLKKRVTNALTSGTLNVAALGLKQIPDEVMQMYESSANSNIVWSEAVDLSKVIFADNDIEHIPDEIFPDWTIEELMDDDDKFNLFGGVEILDLRGNHLTNLPVGLRRLERLHTLNVSNNKLTSAVFDVICQIPNLRDLSIANNEIEGDLPEEISQLSRLHTLDLHDNKIERLGSGLGRLESLQKLNVSGNILLSLDAHELRSESLIELNASRNRLSGTFFTGEISRLEKLQELNVSSNQLQNLCEAALRLPQLQSLVVDNNQLRLLPDLSGVAKLTTLTASENRLEEIPEAFVNLQVLRSANFSGNSIKALDPYISRMDNLSILNIGGNPLRDRKYLSMSTADLKLELAKRLTAVLVTNSEGTIVDRETADNATPTAGGEPSAHYKPDKGILDLSNRKLASIDPSQVDLSKDVYTIRMDGNDFTSFPIDLLIHPSIQPSLQHLDISRNSKLDPTDYLPHPVYLPALRTLQISNTSLTTVDSLTDNLSAPTLQELNISGHRLMGAIPHLKFSFPNLTTLIASDNRFDTIAVDAVRGLEVIDIRNNEIEALPPKLGELGNVGDRREAGRLRAFEVSGNRFRVPRLAVVEKGTEAILSDLRRMVNTDEIGEEWRD